MSRPSRLSDIDWILPRAPFSGIDAFTGYQTHREMMEAAAQFEQFEGPEWTAREVILPEGHPVRGEYRSRHAYRAAVAKWRRGQ